MFDSDANRGNLRVLHLIPSLGQGGAEAAMANLIATYQPGIDHAVTTMIDVPSHFRIAQPIFYGRGRRGQPSPALILQLRQTLRRVRPHILHCWMYHANLLSIASLGSNVRILWSIHSERPDSLSNSMTRLVSATCARLSSIVPDRIAYVAETARAHHEANGYAAAPSVVIPNGIDMLRFQIPVTPRPESNLLRIGLVARYDPTVKGHHFLIDVLATHPLRDRFEIIFAGQGCDTAAQLRDHLASVGLLDRTRLLGAVTVIEAIYAELDILALPSRSEALPMTLLEGAAMGLTICASRVGDIALLGFPEEALFEPDDAADCARALDAAAALAHRPGESLRQRSLVADKFSISTVARRYAELYRSLAKI